MLHCAGSILTAVWSANAGVMARGVNWQRFSQQQLLEICDCVGGLGLAAVLRLMAEDHAGATGGLLLWPSGLPGCMIWRLYELSVAKQYVWGADSCTHVSMNDAARLVLGSVKLL